MHNVKQLSKVVRVIWWFGMISMVVTAPLWGSYALIEKLKGRK